ncbi:hypothetical protein NUW54_g624 [Trametes sanguinea]|uniref:Uncharacterized protein n=1 Tax=Trametes sanguinea TaxID=158606 RepID=A0ACC1QBS7_9APHY|nr:hypothetical protein NUW54_g624 [Trametes sanguinea]
MTDGLTSMSKYSIVERLSALQTYQAAWHSASPRTLKTLCSGCITPYLMLPFSGSVLPLLSGLVLRLISPACSVRLKPYRDWSLDLASYNLRPHFCATDPSQGLLVLCGSLVASPSIIRCHLLHFSDNDNLQSHPSANAPCFTVSCVFPNARTVKVAIRGALLGWLWFDSPPELRVYNWRTGKIVWRCPMSTGFFDFAFLDDHNLLVAQVHRLLVYTIDLDVAAIGTTHWYELDPSSVPSATCLLGLPPVIDGAALYIRTFSSRRPSSTIGRQPLFEMDPSCATIAFTVSVTTSICAPFEQYLIVVPVSAIIAALDTNMSDRAVEIAEASGPLTLQWQSWGARSLILPFLHRETPNWYLTGLSAVGNKVALAFRRPEPYPSLVDVFVFDVQDAGDLEGPNPVDPREFLPPSNHEDCTPQLLDFPIRNRLPYRLIRKVFNYDEHVDSSWLFHSIHLLDDGIALTAWDFDGTTSEVYLISVDAGESGRSTTPMVSEVNGAR